MSTPPESRRARIAAEIRAELARQAMSPTSLASTTGIKVETLRRRLNGTYPFSFEELERICSSLQMKMSDFVERTAA